MATAVTRRSYAHRAVRGDAHTSGPVVIDSYANSVAPGCCGSTAARGARSPRVQRRVEPSDPPSSCTGTSVAASTAPRRIRGRRRGFGSERVVIAIAPEMDAPELGARIQRCFGEQYDHHQAGVLYRPAAHRTIAADVPDMAQGSLVKTSTCRGRTRPGSVDGRESQPRRCEGVQRRRSPWLRSSRVGSRRTPRRDRRAVPAHRLAPMRGVIVVVIRGGHEQAGFTDDHSGSSESVGPELIVFAAVIVAAAAERGKPDRRPLGMAPGSRCWARDRASWRPVRLGVAARAGLPCTLTGSLPLTFSASRRRSGW